MMFLFVALHLTFNGNSIFVCLSIDAINDANRSIAFHFVQFVVVCILKCAERSIHHWVSERERERLAELLSILKIKIENAHLNVNELILFGCLHFCYSCTFSSWHFVWNCLLKHSNGLSAVYFSSASVLFITKIRRCICEWGELGCCRCFGFSFGI